MQSQSVHLTTLFLSRLSPPSRQPVLVHISTTRNWQLPFLNQPKGENDYKKIFHDQSPRKNVARPSLDRTCDLLITSRMGIQLSHLASAYGLRSHFMYWESWGKKSTATDKALFSTKKCFLVSPQKRMIYVVLGCGNTMPDLSSMSHFPMDK